MVGFVKVGAFKSTLSSCFLFLTLCSAWQCGGPTTLSCQNGAVSWNTTAYPGNISLVMNGFANYCNSAYGDCNNYDARLLHNAAFSVKSAFSISAFVDVGTANSAYNWPNNFGSGIGIFDATRNFYILYCAMVTWNGNTYRCVSCVEGCVTKTRATLLP
jgi:hypothetical protein